MGGRPAPPIAAANGGAAPGADAVRWRADRPRPRQLDDWLKDTPEGRAIVTLGFSDAAGGIRADIDDRGHTWFWFHHYTRTRRSPTLRTRTPPRACGSLPAPPAGPSNKSG